MKKYTLYIGLDDRDQKKQIISDNDAIIAIAETIASQGIEGATFTTGFGMYKYEDNTVAFEHSVIVAILDFDGQTENRINKASPIIKARLNQEALALESLEVKSILI